MPDTRMLGEPRSYPEQIESLRAEVARLTAAAVIVQRIQTQHWDRPAVKVVEGRLDREGAQLQVQAVVPNAYQPEDTVELDIWTYLPPMPTPEAFDLWLSWRLARIAIHESNEWLRRDGRPIFDPHAITPDGAGPEAKSGSAPPTF